MAALCNKEGGENASTRGQSAIGFLLLISASAHRQFEDTLKNILRSAASKDTDRGGGTTHDNLLPYARQFFAHLRRTWSYDMYFHARKTLALQCGSGPTHTKHALFLTFFL